MGCSCTQYNSSISKLDEIFTSIPIRSKNYEDINERLDISEDNKGKKSLSEQTFQIFLNDYLIGFRVQDDKQDLQSYWINFYRTKPTVYQKVFIKFNFFFLSSNKYNGKVYEKNKNLIEEKDIDYLKKIFSEYRSIRYGGNNINFFSYSLLSIFLEDYIFSITKLLFEHFHKLLDEETHRILDYTLFDTSLDTVNFVSLFIQETFFKDINDMNAVVDLQQFFNTHWNFLKDDCRIRSHFLDFIVEKDKE